MDTADLFRGVGGGEGKKKGLILPELKKIGVLEEVHVLRRNAAKAVQIRIVQGSCMQIVCGGGSLLKLKQALHHRSF